MVLTEEEEEEEEEDPLKERNAALGDENLFSWLKASKEKREESQPARFLSMISFAVHEEKVAVPMSYPFPKFSLLCFLYVSMYMAGCLFVTMFQFFLCLRVIVFLVVILEIRRT